MKLQDWADQYRILEINARLPPEYQWPRLPELFAALETFPRISKEPAGFGIFIGWRTPDRFWVYHHAVCVPGHVRDSGHERYGFNNAFNEDNMLHAKPIPTINSGELPESADFVQLLQRVGFPRIATGAVMVTPSIAAKKDGR